MAEDHSSFVTVELSTDLGKYYFHIDSQSSSDAVAGIVMAIEQLESYDKIFKIDPAALPFEQGAPAPAPRRAPSAPPQRTQQRPATQQRGRPNQIKDPNATASPAQIGRIFAIGRKKGWSNEDIKGWVADRFNGVGVDDLTKGEASQAGDDLERA